MSFGIKGISNDTSLFNALLWYRNYALSPTSVRNLISLYSEDPRADTTYPPYNINNNALSPYPTAYGTQWRRACAIGGDLVMVGQRRMMCEVMTNAASPVWSYRFNTRPWNVSEWDGIKHFVNVAFSFQNVSGLLGPAGADGAAARRQVSEEVGQAYIRFVNAGNPNRGRGVVVKAESGNYKKGKGLSITWPKWNDGTGTLNLVFDAKGSFVENDDWRAQEIAYINTLSRELLG